MKKMIDDFYEYGLVGSFEWFVSIKKCEFDLEEKPCNGRTQEFQSDVLHLLLEDNPTQSTL